MDLSGGEVTTFPPGTGLAIPSNEQGRVVRKVDDAIQWINLYPVDSVIRFPNTNPLDSDLSSGFNWCQVVTYISFQVSIIIHSNVSIS